MAAPKYVRLASGVLTETATGASGGAGDADKIPALDANGQLTLAMMPSGIGADTETIQASENLAAGDFVNVHNSTGARVRKADASNGRQAHGYVLAGVTSGANATVYFEGSNTQVSGLTPGDVMYLSASAAGQATATPPSTSGQIVQRLGVAVSATRINTEFASPVTLA